MASVEPTEEVCLAAAPRPAEGPLWPEACHLHGLCCAPPECFLGAQRYPDGDQKDEWDEHGVERVHPWADVASASGKERLHRSESSERKRPAGRAPVWPEGNERRNEREYVAEVDDLAEVSVDVERVGLSEEECPDEEK